MTRHTSAGLLCRFNGTAESPRSEPNPFSTDPGDELPVGLQLTWRLRALIATGRLASGERLPSFRRLSEWAGVNVNTVRAVYAGLEEEGLVVSRQGQGTFVADGIEAAPQLEEIATEALRRAQRGGAQPARPGDRRLGLREHARRRWARLPARRRRPSFPISPRRARRSRSATSCGGRSAGSRPSWPPTRATCRASCRRRRAAPSAHVAGVEELEQTRDTLIAQLSEAQRRPSAPRAGAGSDARRREDGSRQPRRRPARAGDELVASTSS